MIESTAQTPDLDARWRFQTALNTALAAYLHGSDLSRAGRLLFPLVDAPRSVRRNALDEVRAAAVDLGMLLSGEGPECLAAGYRALDGLAPPAGAMREFVLEAWSEERHGRVTALADARRRLRAIARRTGLEFFLHGSHASLDFTGYSDLDTFVLLPRTAACDAGGLRAARRALVETWRAVKAFDPLQHHGHFLLTEVDLRGYPDPLFPGVILERTVALTPRRRILRARGLPAPALAAARFRRAASGYLATNLDRGRANAYRLKSDLSVFMLLPALWWQARGRPVSKKRSFEEAYALLSPGTVDVFRRAAEIRDVWRYHEPVWNGWLRRVWFNPLLPAALDAAGARAPAPAVRRLVDTRFLDGTKAAVRELMELFEHGGAGLA